VQRSFLKNAAGIAGLAQAWIDIEEGTVKRWAGGAVGARVFRMPRNWKFSRFSTTATRSRRGTIYELRKGEGHRSKPLAVARSFRRGLYDGRRSR